MVSFLQVPAPRGELGEIEYAAAELERTAAGIADGATGLGQTWVTVDADWLGRAADTYARQTLRAQDTLTSVSMLHGDAARTLQRYAEEWDRAQRASEQGMADIADAVGGYASAAGDAVHHIVSRLRPLLDSPVGDLLSLVPGVGAIIDRLLSWTAPLATPETYTLVEDRVEPVDAEDVLEEVQSGLDWGISRLLEGIEAVADLAGDIVAEAIDLFHRVERALADAVAEAQRLVREALEALFAAGVAAAAELSRLAVEVHRFGRTAVTSTVHFLTDVGGTAAGATVTAATRLQQVMPLGPWTELWPARRRIPEDRVEALDDAAFDRLLSDRDHQLRVGATMRLSDWAYDREYGRPHGMEGWGRLRKVDGRDGFAASVFEGPEGEVVVAYRGTEPADLRDWGVDILNGFNLPTSQGAQAIELAREVIANHPDRDVQFTGHSLGGSLASIASLATGRPATTFNAAGVGDSNYLLAMAAGGKGKSQEQITNFHSGNDAVTMFQAVPDPVHPAAGAQVEVPSNTDSMVEAHGMVTLHAGFATMGLSQLDERWP